MNDQTKDRIRGVLRTTMNNTIRRRVELEPFDPEEQEVKNPFGYRLLPLNEIWKSSKFERSFVTSLGQRVFEQVALIIAEGTGSYAEIQHHRDIRINTFRKERIDNILDEERRNLRVPNWNAELQEVLVLQNNSYQELNITYDLYIRRPDNSEEFYSIKTVKPNLDQTEIAKKNMMYTKAVLTESRPYFALPHNPAGEGRDYRTAHSIPYKIFDMTNDPCVLIGSDFWNTVGQDQNTYNELLEVFEEIGQEYSQIIRRNYLGIE